MFEADLKECFSRMQNGDKEAFAQIYTMLKQPVFTIVRRILQNTELAEDVTQDIFVKLFVSPPDSSIRNLRAWIFQIARNLAIDTLRKQQRSESCQAEAFTEDEISSFIVRRDMESAICKLPWDEREILTLHINADLPFHEIAHIVGLSLPATYRKYRKAIKTLQKLLDGGTL